ncbi:MAG: ShlB/FhaC/HecB family hemolysin secretion/activation protein [Gammaproteobacteria bacterium]
MMKRYLTLALLLFWTVSAAFAAEISAVRVSGEARKARVVFDLDEGVQYKTFRLTQPERLVIDIQDGRILATARRQSSGNDVLDKIRMGKREWNVLRIVLDLKQAVDYVHYTLPPEAGRRHRLVVDMQLQLPSPRGEDLSSLAVMIDQKNYAAAYAWAHPRLRQWRGDKEFYFMLGLAANETGHAEQAIRPLQQYVIQQPEHLWARLELARAFYLADKLALARQEFQLVLATGPPAQVRTNIENFLERISAQLPPDSPHFFIAGFRVSGNSLLEEATLTKTLAPFAGEHKNFGDIQKAVDALQAVYREAGYGATYVYLPEQELVSQIVQIRVIEPRIAKVTIQGHQFHDETNIRASLPALDENIIPDTLAIAENVKHANENASKNIRLQFLATDEVGLLNAVINVEDKATDSWFASLDNSGTQATGDTRLSMGYQQHNLFNQDHVLNLNYTTSADKPDKVTIYGIGYHLPKYHRNADVDFYAGRSDVDSGVVGNIFTVSGQGTVLGARYKSRLRQRQGFAHNLTYGLDYRAYDNKVIPLNGGSSLVPDITVRPISLGYDATWQLRRRQVSLNTQLIHNLAGGSNGDDAAFAASRTHATADYNMLRFGLDYLQLLASDWQWHVAVQGQVTADALVAGEQFGLGGASSVRGFEERQVSNDRGYQLNLEAYSPEFCARGTDLGQYKCRGLLFVDAGAVSRNQALPGETRSDSIASLGVGLRLTRGEQLSFVGDLAYVLDGGTVRQDGDTRLHAKLMYHF